MADSLKLLAAHFFATLGALLEIVALLLWVAVGATVVASLSYLWYGGEAARVFVAAVVLAAAAVLAYLSSFALGRAKLALDGRRGFEVRPAAPTPVMAPTEGARAPELR